MSLAGRAVAIHQDNVDTDVLYPGSYLNIEDPELMSPHLFEGLDPGLRDELGPDTVLVVGENFGTGSSREHVPLAMKASGVSCLVGKSFARIFRRNCLNLGLPLVDCPDAVARADTGARVQVDLDAGLVIVDGEPFAIAPMPDFMRRMVDAGGLIPWLRRQPA
ncbi:MAG TPA: 3-isopropylmalate dehydratase small subunit [Solirubrobacteraceae bacterium]|nr:3-isopropylmalate dehydratase small subunit [Solirubrobacteraceae bacterium]